MPVTNTQDVWNRNSVELRHINPSIMEGELGHTSLFGHGSAVMITRYAPTFLVQPTITGSIKIPSTLTCNPGVINSSPQAKLYFQWKMNGVDILDATERTFVTDNSHDKDTLTCEVTAVNYLGVDIGLSNGITAELVEPVRMEGYSLLSLTGMSQENQINNLKTDTLIATGISQPARSDVQQQVALVGSGLWVETRNDVFSKSVNAISGLNSPNETKIFEHEAYSFWRPTYLEDQVIINPSAETGDMTGWTVTAGTVTSEIDQHSGSSLHPSGGRFFSSRYSGKFEAHMHQIMDINAGLLTDIDAGVILARYAYDFDTFTHVFQHQINSTITVYNASDVSLYTENLRLTRIQSDSWTTNYTELFYLPPNSRKIRIDFVFEGSLSYDVLGFVDEIVLKYYKDERQI